MIDNILDEHQSVDDLDIPGYAKDWFQALIETPVECKLPKLSALISAKRYAEIFNEANEKKASFPEDLHYTL